MEKSKKKLLTIVTSLCVAVAVVVASVAAIFAALMQNVSTNFTVMYQATDVSATVSANYALENGEAVAMTTNANGTGDTSLEFVPNRSGGGRRNGS